MGFSYFPQTEGDIREMLERIGADSLDGLYSDVPEEFMFRGEFDLPEAMTEMEIRRRFLEMAGRNRSLTVFCGCGAYDHYSPAVIPALISRAEFQTAYTPYQAEVSQGTLRYIFEYQSMITMLTGLDCSNASMYDGATAAAEAVMMALACTKKKSRVLLSGTLLPQVIRVVETYARWHGISLDIIESEDGCTSAEDMKRKLGQGDVAGVLVPTVNRYGIIEDLSGYSEALHGCKALLITYSDPSSLAVLKTPGEWGADIACGDCQSLGLPLSFGGPYAGYLACRREHVRKTPGRSVGGTVDMDGKRSYVLTLQAREQHIRREKATSNICSNQSLMALYVTIYLSLLGREGLREVNELSFGGAHYLYDSLIATGLFEPVFDKPFLKEFVLKTSLPVEELQRRLNDAGFFAALATEEGYVSFCVTEKRTREEIDALVACVRVCGELLTNAKD